jgi:hypothetical protein
MRFSLKELFFVIIIYFTRGPLFTRLKSSNEVVKY